MHTHQSITHPALRFRMAQALNQLRHAAVIFPNLAGIISSNLIGRVAYREMAERMASLEQALDTEQEARIFEKPEFPYGEFDNGNHWRGHADIPDWDSMSEHLRRQYSDEE